MNRPRVLITMLLALAGIVRADQSVTIAWDPNPEPDVRAYIIYYGNASRDYPYHTNVGNVTTATVYGLKEGVTWYFAITSTNAAGLESDYSNEITNHIPSLAELARPRRQKPDNPGQRPAFSKSPAPVQNAPKGAVASKPDKPNKAARPATAKPAPGGDQGFFQKVADKFHKVAAKLQTSRGQQFAMALLHRGIRWLLFGFGGFALVLVVVWLAFLLRYRTAEGVIENQPAAVGDESQPVVTYRRADGSVGTLKPTPNELSPNAAAGDTVAVLYHPTRMGVAWMKSRSRVWKLWRLPVFAGLLALLFIGMSLWHRSTKPSPVSQSPPAESPEQRAAESVACRSRLEFFGLAVQLWAFDHGGALPTNIFCLKEQLKEPSALVCPSDKTNALLKVKSWANFDPTKSSYDISFPGTKGGDSVTVIGRCKLHGHILHATLMSSKVLDAHK